MILMTIQDDQHVDDGDLVRLLDGECGFEEDRMLRQHLASCSKCKSRYDSVSQLAQRFSTLFVAFDEQLQRNRAPSAPAVRKKGLTALGQWWSRRPTRLIAVIATVVLLLTAAAPVRALVVAGWEAFLSLVIGSRVESPTEQQGSSVVSFIPTQPTFVIELAHAQRSGRLTLSLDTLPTASARITEGSWDDEIVVLANGLRIVNSTGSTASYRIRVPLLVQVVEVTIEGELIEKYELARARVGSQWEMDLTNSGT